MSASCLDANIGNYIIMDETVDEIVKAVVSSSAMYFFFPTQKWPDGAVCMDGGTVWSVNLVNATEKCREIVDNDS